MEIRLELEHGRITAARFLGDFFSAEEPEALEPLLLGRALTREELAPVLAGVDVSRFFLGLDAEGLLDLLCGN